LGCRERQEGSRCVSLGATAPSLIGMSGPGRPSGRSATHRPRRALTYASPRRRDIVRRAADASDSAPWWARDTDVVNPAPLAQRPDVRSVRGRHDLPKGARAWQIVERKQDLRRKDVPPASTAPPIGGDGTSHESCSRTGRKLTCWAYRSDRRKPWGSSRTARAKLRPRIGTKTVICAGASAAAWRP